MRFLRQSGLGDEDIIVAVDALTRPIDEAGIELVYTGLDDAREGLRHLVEVPPGWFERTEQGADTARGYLIFRALYSLAWLHHHYEVRSVLSP